MFDSMIEAMLPGVNSLLSFAVLIYNKLVEMAVGLLGQNPAAFNGSGWTIVENVNRIFISVGGVLTGVFFLMGFCAESLDIRQDFRIENLMRMFIKLLLAEFFVVNSLTLVKSFFGLATGLIEKMSGSQITASYVVPDRVQAVLKEPLENGISDGGGLGWVLILYIMGIGFLLAVAGCGMMVLYEAFQRFFKIMLLAPYGTLACSTIAGNHTLNRSAEAFFKYALGTILEAVTMYLALALAAAVLKGGAVSLTEGAEGGLYVLGWMLEGTFVCMLTLGSVKGAAAVTQKALGL